MFVMVSLTKRSCVPNRAMGKADLDFVYRNPFRSSVDSSIAFPVLQALKITPLQLLYYVFFWLFFFLALTS